ncbi:hypothetical protein MRY87_03650 [bacterium]|nr:hypothetical protein [bacterium]
MKDVSVPSVRQARYNALEGIQQLLILADDIPSAQLRLLVQAACLDVATSVEELSDRSFLSSRVTEKQLGPPGS